MRRGLIAMGQIECKGCGKTIGYGEQYMMEGNKEERWCLACCLDKGEAAEVEDKNGERYFTFFPPLKSSKRQ